ncbi:hypothetical protein [Spirosoma flavum]|uniref:PBCV-specific basic adaptor domain-containing protein n=1 Tax=Spirosoma flavum TaxID=2048557 RepID=A0ABW6AKQ8_9BACT
MKKPMLWFNFLASLLISFSVLAQTGPSPEKMPVPERMAKARAAKADKKVIKGANQDASGTTATINGNQAEPNQRAGSMKEEKATSADYSAPVVKSLKGPNGEVVHTGEHGGKYYINKNGNKTYLSSNQ